MRRLSPLALLAALLLASIATGCAFTKSSTNLGEAVSRHEALYGAATKYATLKVLEKNQKHTARVLEIVRAVRDDIDGGSIVPLPALEERVRAEVRWDKLTAEESMLVDALVTTVRQELERATVGLQAPDDVRLVLVKVLTWVEEAAAMRGGVQ